MYEQLIKCHAVCLVKATIACSRGADSEEIRYEQGNGAENSARKRARRLVRGHDYQSLLFRAFFRSLLSTPLPYSPHWRQRNSLLLRNQRQEGRKKLREKPKKLDPTTVNTTWIPCSKEPEMESARVFTWPERNGGEFVWKNWKGQASI